MNPPGHALVARNPQVSISRWKGRATRIEDAEGDAPRRRTRGIPHAPKTCASLETANSSIRIPRDPGMRPLAPAKKPTRLPPANPKGGGKHAKEAQRYAAAQERSSRGDVQSRRTGRGQAQTRRAGRRSQYVAAIDPPKTFLRFCRLFLVKLPGQPCRVR